MANNKALIGLAVAGAGIYLLWKAYTAPCEMAVEIPNYTVNIPAQLYRLTCLVTDAQSVIMSIAGTMMLWYGGKKTIEEI